uniref:Uncharacterized protein n=1 Tax=Arundo donax TaxID=35708 RepID=A0A0A9FVE9_ARUDO
MAMGQTTSTFVQDLDIQLPIIPIMLIVLLMLSFEGLIVVIDTLLGLWVVDLTTFSTAIAIF